MLAVCIAIAIELEEKRLREQLRKLLQISETIDQCPSSSAWHAMNVPHDTHSEHIGETAALTLRSRLTRGRVEKGTHSNKQIVRHCTKNHVGKTVEGCRALWDVEVLIIGELGLEMSTVLTAKATLFV